LQSGGEGDPAGQAAQPFGQGVAKALGLDLRCGEDQFQCGVDRAGDHAVEGDGGLVDPEGGAFHLYFPIPELQGETRPVAAEMMIRPGGGQVGHADPAGEVRLVLPAGPQGERDIGFGLAAVDRPRPAGFAGQGMRQGET